MSNNIQLGRLKRADARNIWTSESGDFTPWLSEEHNLQLLSDTIDLDLELEAIEKDVGPFRADILCKDTVHGTWVLIENQLARTDHTHLGQLLTYAAGLKAVTIIWIASPFTEEHRAALDWLNDVTDTQINFFGLEIELWQIGNSAVAPKFNIVSKPNDWRKTVAEGASRVELTDAKQLQLDFWTAFASFVDNRDCHIRPRKPHPQHWMSMAIGRSGVHLSAIASLWNTEAETYDSNEVRAELVMMGPNSEIFMAHLEAMRDDIEDEIGHRLTWYNPADKSQKKIFVRRDADLWDRSTWPGLHNWLVQNLDNFYEAFRPRIKSLRLPEEDGELTRS